MRSIFWTGDCRCIDGTRSTEHVSIWCRAFLLAGLGGHSTVLSPSAIALATAAGAVAVLSAGHGEECGLAQDVCGNVASCCNGPTVGGQVQLHFEEALYGPWRYQDERTPWVGTRRRNGCTRCAPSFRSNIERIGTADRSRSSFRFSGIVRAYGPEKTDETGRVDAQSIEHVLRSSVDRRSLPLKRVRNKLGVELKEVAEERTRPQYSDRIGIYR